MSSATILGVTGIVVSGVLGPVVAAWVNRHGDRERAARDLEQRRREDLEAVVDDGAVLLGAGETNLRLAHEAASRGEAPPAEVGEWAGRVHLLGQRLRLRLPADDPVVQAYEAVRAALLSVGATYGDADHYTAVVADFEAKRSEFLDESRLALARIART
jgi:hypothetical protein